MLAKTITISAIASSVLFSLPSLAASFTVTEVKTGAFVDVNPDTTVNNVTYLDQTLPITGITADGKDFVFNTLPTPELTLQRSGAAGAANRQVVWGERTTTGNPNNNPVDVRIPLPTSTEELLQGNNLFGGTDNLFVNAGNSSGNQSDVERADFVIDTGFQVKPTQGVVVFERGSNNSHDGFKIAAITSIDGSGNPTGFANLQQISTGWGNVPLRVSSQTPPPVSTNPPYLVLNDSSGTFDDTANITNQNIGGVLITLDTLATEGTTIFGWSLFGSDVNDGGNPANLLDVTNPNFYPPSSIEATTQGGNGIDLLAGNVGVAAVVPEPTSMLASLAIFGLGAGFKLKKTNKKS